MVQARGVDLLDAEAALLAPGEAGFHHRQSRFAAKRRRREETRCVLRGDPYREIRAAYDRPE
jgi:hypothetical protein